MLPTQTDLFWETWKMTTESLEVHISRYVETVDIKKFQKY